MSERKAKLTFVSLTALIVGGITFGLYQFTGYYGKPHEHKHGWEIWPVNSHHIIFPIYMLLGWIVFGLLFLGFWLETGDQTGWFKS